MVYVVETPRTRNIKQRARFRQNRLSEKQHGKHARFGSAETSKLRCTCTAPFKAIVSYSYESCFVPTCYSEPRFG